MLAEKIEELVKLGVHPETMIGAAANMDDAGPDTSAPPPGTGGGDGASNTKDKAVADAVDVEAVEIVNPAREPDDGTSAENRKSRKRRRKKSGGRGEATVARTADRDDGADDESVSDDRGSEVKSGKAAAAAATVVVPATAVTASTDDIQAGNPDDVEAVIDSDKAAARSVPARSVPTTAPGKQRPAPAEPQIFVSPRAPDDPGTDQSEKSATSGRSAMMPFQPAKG